jgi:hypothetical protein
MELEIVGLQSQPGCSDEEKNPSSAGHLTLVGPD